MSTLSASIEHPLESGCTYVLCRVCLDKHTKQFCMSSDYTDDCRILSDVKEERECSQRGKGQKGNKERLIERIKRIFISSSKTAQNTPQKKIKNTQNICVCQKIFVPLCSKIRKYQNTKIKKVKSTKEKNVRQRKDYHNKRGTCWSRVLYKVRRYYFTS